MPQNSVVDSPTELPVTLWVSPVSNLAGVARHILDAARVGVPGWRLEVACPDGPLADRLEEQHVRVHRLQLEQPVPGMVKQLRSIIRTVQPRIVHSHLAKADFLSAMASVGTGARLVSTEHHIPEDPLIFHGTRWKATTRQLAHHVRIRRFRQLTAVSASTKRDMLRYWRPSAPITVILNGVDRPAHPTPREPGLRVLSLTRLAAEKNIEMTLRVFARVVAEHPQARLTVAGEGPMRAQLHNVTASLGLTEAVDFPGFVDPVAAMASHDVLMQPSKADNFSYTLLDAIAAGMGVVASPVGGNPEMLPPQCIVSLDDEAGMADAVVTQGLDMSQRPHLTEAIPTVAEMTEQIAAVYATV